MSSILKALKKLEKEKSVTVRSADAATTDSLSTGVRFPLLPLLAGVIVGGIVVFLIFFLRENEPPVVAHSKVFTENAPAGTTGDRTAVESREFEPVVNSAVESMPTVVEQNTDMDEFLPVVQEKQSDLTPLQHKKPSAGKQAAAIATETVAEEVASQVTAPVTETSDLTLANQANMPDFEVESVSELVAEGGVSDVRMETGDIPRPGYEKVGDGPVAPDLAFLLSEIFYVEGGAANMAVVNDLPVMEGTLVDGALLKEIHPEHVIFDVDGFLVKVPLTPPAAD